MQMKACVITPQLEVLPLKRVGIHATLVGGVARILLSQTYDTSPGEGQPCTQEESTLLGKIGSLGDGSFWSTLPVSPFVELEEIVVECMGRECVTEVIQVRRKQDDPLFPEPDEGRKRFPFLNSDNSGIENRCRSRDGDLAEAEQRLGEVCTEFAMWWIRENTEKRTIDVALSRLPDSLKLRAGKEEIVVNTTCVQKLYDCCSCILFHFPLTVLPELVAEVDPLAGLLPFTLHVDVRLAPGLIDPAQQPRSITHDMIVVSAGDSGRHFAELSLDDEVVDSGGNTRGKGDADLHNGTLWQVQLACSRDLLVVVPLRRSLNPRIVSPSTMGFLVLFLLLLLYYLLVLSRPENKYGVSIVS